MNLSKLRAEVSREWAEHALPSLTQLIRIPAVSPAYDPAWHQNGHLHAAVRHVKDWVEARDLPGVRCEILEIEGRPPVLFVEAGDGPDTTLLYGHLDRQPPTGEWAHDPWQPTFDGDRLYGRGTVDDSYSAYVAVGALVALRAVGGTPGRVVMLLETAEESASVDLPAYLDLLGPRLGEISLVVCLDSGGEDHDRPWLTTSLRGIVQATVTVRVLDTPVHSGLASGIVPDSFRIMRALLDRVEDAATGDLPAFHAPIPDYRVAEARALAALPNRRPPAYPLYETTRAVSSEAVELILNNTWRPALTITGAAGLPAAGSAVPIVRDSTSLRLSLRLPPTVLAADAAHALVSRLTSDVPYDASVSVTDLMLINGWNAPPLAPWLAAALEVAFDGVPAQSIGLGGGIPFMEMLGNRYPEAQFVVTGAVRADSHVHAPDEWLSVSFARRLTVAVAGVLDAHARRHR
ncbi:M20/M25/M40 family metallo-hydrolase [Actinoplanes sp. TBRC 11911]|uniref:M20/M25/M40 family metallo-hydrolase n=1 Tax=Actinoplanes sp. TBRC 11911 TaxID=2729386 RepID=UPI00145E65D0|nr:M20/M25/M40 family metallo-hydrolase [Actinoplanes sp. TBRC 11911]NMO55526.1 M20/M25/M40 family metallo-hydrolase [Actinoplanes sp. TBRC 11911]